MRIAQHRDGVRPKLVFHDTKCMFKDYREIIYFNAPARSNNIKKHSGNVVLRAGGIVS